MPTCLPPVVKGVNNLPAVGVVSSFYPLAGLFLQVKVARLDFLGLIPPKFEH